jgi:hypothetical protein
MGILVGLDFETKLRCDHYLVTHRSESFAHKFFIHERTVNLSRIEEGDASLDRSPHDRNHFLLASRDSAVACAHPHTA